MPLWVGFVALLGLMLLIGWGIRKDRELFALRVSHGRVVVARGRIPAALLGELEDVLARSGSTGRLVAVRSTGHAELRLQGQFPGHTAQRLRNVVGQVPLARILGTPRRTTLR